MEFKEPDLIFKISVLSMENVGKDTLIKNYFQDRVFDHGSMITHGVDFATKDLELYGKFARSSIWVFSSEDEFRELFKYYINGSNGIILMYDITNTETLNDLTEWINRIRKHTKEETPILLVGNKLDLVENREVSKDNVEKFKEKHAISSSMEISLKTGENVGEMYIKLIEMVYMHWKESLNQ